MAAGPNSTSRSAHGRHLGEGKAIPDGTYDLAQNQALVNVGVSHDTAEFAVESIRRWWRMLGRRSYPRAGRLLICADAGGSNGNRLRTWKVHLQGLAKRHRDPDLGDTYYDFQLAPGGSRVSSKLLPWRRAAPNARNRPQDLGCRLRQTSKSLAVSRSLLCFHL